MVPITDAENLCDSVDLFPNRLTDGSTADSNNEFTVDAAKIMAASKLFEKSGPYNSIFFVRDNDLQGHNRLYQLRGFRDYIDGERVPVKRAEVAWPFQVTYTFVRRSDQCFNNENKEPGSIMAIPDVDTLTSLDNSSDLKEVKEGLKPAPWRRIM